MFGAQLTNIIILTALPSCLDPHIIRQFYNLLMSGFLLLNEFYILKHSRFEKIQGVSNKPFIGHRKLQWIGILLVLSSSCNSTDRTCRR